MAELLSGKLVREKITESLKARVAGLGFVPKLAIIQVGDREDSSIYIRNKIKFGQEIGVEVEHLKFDASVSEREVLEKISGLNLDEAVNGIIVQLPLPAEMDAAKLTQAVAKSKDVDGLGFEDVGEMHLMPATTRAIFELLDFYQIDVKGKKVAIIGRSRLVGAPTAEMFRREGAEVSICHRGTQNMPDICKSADILISAAGQANLVTKDFVNALQTVIDVGINKLPLPDSEKSRIVGDVNFEEVEPIVKNITPVPGGVGPLTVSCLFENLLDLASR
jgi:methylenetetrahydrofolate dehydrogenase (NADP+)/methenyltetrahydrofolate cyclohydrolase